MLSQEFFKLRWKDLESEHIHNLRIRWIAPDPNSSPSIKIGIIVKIFLDLDKGRLSIKFINVLGEMAVKTCSLAKLSNPFVLSTGMILIRMAPKKSSGREFIQILSDTDNPLVSHLFPPRRTLEEERKTILKGKSVAEIPPAPVQIPAPA